MILKDGNIFTREPASSICDENGKLLFYTNAEVIMNAMHDTMPNGKGLGSNTSSTQGALIVPHPGNSNLYYVFTVDFEGNSKGMQYSIVDMSLQGGLGDVTVKNKQLVTPVLEKLTAVHHENGKDIWVLVHGFQNKNFYAYKVGESGIDETPVVTAVGPTYGALAWDKFAAIGNMKFSHCGDYIATSRYGKDTLDLFRFDNSTGIVCDHIAITSPSEFLNFNNTYGIEFSPDDSKLYTGTYQGGQLFQLSLDTYDPVAISNSTIEMGQCNCTTMGDVQLGPDGRIYVAYEHLDFIGVVENPNESAPMAKFTPNAIPIDSSQTLRLSLPDFVQSMVIQPVCSQPQNQAQNFLGNDTIICRGDILRLDANQSGAMYTWNDGSTMSFLDVSDSGDYWVISFLSECKSKSDTIRVDVREGVKPELGTSDTTLCDNDLLELNVTTSGADAYAWEDGSTDSVRQINQSGLYWVEITSGPCKSRDSINVAYVQPINDLELGNDTVLCEGDKINLSINTPGVDIIWEDGQTTSTRSVSSPGVYEATISTACDTVTDQIEVAYSSCECFIHIPNVFRPNNDGLNDYFKPEITCDMGSFEMDIYNRWGEWIHATNDPNTGWDGTYRNSESPLGVYLYIISFEHEGVIFRKSGTFHLME